MVYEEYNGTRKFEGVKVGEKSLEKGAVVGCNREQEIKYTPDSVKPKGGMIEKLSDNLRHVAEGFCDGLKQVIMKTLANNGKASGSDPPVVAQKMGTVRTAKGARTAQTPQPDQSRNPKDKGKGVVGQSPQEQKGKGPMQGLSRGVEKRVAPSQDKGEKRGRVPYVKCNKEHGGACTAGTSMPKKQAQPQGRVVQEKRGREENKTSPERKRQQTAKGSLAIGGTQPTPSQMGKTEISYCGKCSKKHLGECRIGTNKCYRCGKARHVIKECPEENSRMGAWKRAQGPYPQFQV